MKRTHLKIFLVSKRAELDMMHLKQSVKFGMIAPLKINLSSHDLAHTEDIEEIEKSKIIIYDG